MRLLLACAIAAALVPGVAAADPERAAPPVIDVTAAEAERLGLEWGRPSPVTDVAFASSTAEVVGPPAQEVVVSAPVAGLVTQLLVAEGSKVDTGAPLVEIKSAELLELQREYLDGLTARRLADAHLTRDEDLNAEGIIARRRLEETKAAAEAARVRAEQARQRLEIAGFEADAIEDLAAARQIMPALTLRAPFAGTVVARHVALGEQVEPLEPVARIANLSRLWLEVGVPQERADRVGPGMRIEITAGGQRLSGEVFYVAEIVDPPTQTVRVRAEIDNSAGILRRGQVLPARITSAAQAAWAVPASAVIRVDGAAHVFARTSTGGFELKTARVVGGDGASVHIDGAELGPDIEVAVEGVSALKSLMLGGEE